MARVPRQADIKRLKDNKNYSDLKLKIRSLEIKVNELEKLVNSFKEVHFQFQKSLSLRNPEE